MANQIDSIEVVIQARAQEAQAALARLTKQLTALQSGIATLTNQLNNSGYGAKYASTSLKSYSSAASTATISSTKLALAIGKVWAMFGGLRGAIRLIGSSLTLSSQLTEIQNVIDQTFGAYQGALQEFGKTSITEYGISELTAKQMAGRYQAMGVAMGISREQAAGMSLEITKLAADLASFYDRDVKEVGEALNATFTGMTRPMRQFGVDLTQATLKEFALANGMDADIASMTQAQKTMLRYQYILQATSAAQGDFQRTSQTWHNQVTMLKENFKALGMVIGSGLVQALKPFVQAMNAALQGLIEFSKKVLNALGKIFGWELEASGGGVAIDDAVWDAADAAGALDDSASGAAGSLGKAAQAAKKLKTITLGIDELNINAPESPSSGSGSGSGGSGGGAGGAGGSGLASSGDISYEWKRIESIWEKDLSLWDVGRMISDKIREKLEGIDWESIFEKARNFGSGLADFLNGLIDPETFRTIGETFANGLNTIIYAIHDFLDTFDASNFGLALAERINGFFSTFDWRAFGETVGLWAKKIQETVTTFISNIDWKEVFKSVGEFFQGLGVDGIGALFGVIAMAKFAKNLKTYFTNLIKGNVGGFMGNITMSFGVIIGVLGFFDTFGNPITEKGIKWVAEQFFGTNLSDQDVQKVMDDLGISFKLKDMFEQLRQAFTGEYYQTEEFMRKNSLYKIFWNWGDAGNWKMEQLYSRIGEPLATKFFTVIKAAFLSVGQKMFNDLLAPLLNNIADALERFGFPDMANSVRNWVQSISESIGDAIEEENPVGEFEIETENPKPKVERGVAEAKRFFAQNKKLGSFDISANGVTGLQQVRDKANSWLEQNKLSYPIGTPDLTSPVKKGWDQATNWLNKNPLKVSVKTPQAKVTGTETIQGTGSWSKVTVPKIEFFAMGGFPTADLFYANENGVPELVGTVGGRTAVASGNEITGIRDAVNNGTATEANLLNTAIGLLRIIANNSGSSGSISQRDLYTMVENQRKRNGYSFT